MRNRYEVDIKEEFPVKEGKLRYWISSKFIQDDAEHAIQYNEKRPDFVFCQYVYACPASYELFSGTKGWEKEDVAQRWFNDNLYIQNLVAIYRFNGVNAKLATLNIREYRMWLDKFQIEDCEDAREAYKLRKGAEQGILDDQYHLGTRYYKGCGVVKDEKEAVKWYSKAAEQGHYWAEYNLGYMYYSGAGVKKDLGEAVKWWRKAAKKEDRYRFLTLATDALAEL